jgi:hypothetical protein
MAYNIIWRGNWREAWPVTKRSLNKISIRVVSPEKTLERGIFFILLALLRNCNNPDTGLLLCICSIFPCSRELGGSHGKET